MINNFRGNKSNNRPYHSENLYEENDLVNVSIKTQTLDQEKNELNSKKPKNEMNSYGGI